MFEKFNQLRTIFESSQSYLVPYVSAEDLTQFAEQMADRTANNQPIVMVYGVYNAGKSTLINALLGREAAEMGDIPKTDVVSAYPIGDVVLYDSPGIDAPIEHEKISREQLEKSDAVVFVLSSDGVLEEQKTYDEIRAILAANKPMVMVINNKSAYQPHEAEYITLIEKFRANLYQQFAGDAALLAQLDKMPDFLINANLALKGRLTGRDKLVELSQINALENALRQLFVETNSTQVAKTLAYQLGLLVQKALMHAQQQTKQDELQRLQELITDFSKSQSSVLHKVVAYADKAKPGLKTEFIHFAQQGQSDAMQAQVMQWQESIVGYFETQLQRELKRLDAEAVEVNKLFIDVPLNGAQSAEDTNDAGLGLGIDDLLKSLANKGVKLGLPESMAKEGIVTALKQGKNWFPKLFKGIGPKTMEKMAGRVTPFIGPAIDTAMAFYDYHQANQYEMRQIEQQRQHLERAKNQAVSIVDELYVALYEEVEDVLDETFSPLIKGLKQNLTQLSKQSNGVEATIANLNQLQLQLQRF